MKRIFEFMIVALFVVFATGCPSQAPVTPQPTATISWPAVTCPSGYACGYIVSRATCASSTTCPTPASNGPYTPLQTTASLVAGTNFTDIAPPTGTDVAYAIQFVETAPGGQPWTGAPSPASVPQLIALYPATPGQPIVTTTAELAPPLLPDSPAPVSVASNIVPTVRRPTVIIRWQ